jgi:L-iditol 2-dehydrogenase
MKAAFWYNNQDIRIKNIALPTPGPKEMLVKVISCGICGSDIIEWYRLPRAPLIQGHEIGARVVQVGRSIKQYRRGDRVFIAPKVPCMKCAYCKRGHYPQCSEVKIRLPGGFAEYILVPEMLVKRGTYLLPSSITYDQSTFIEPLACVVRAQKHAGINKGQTILVIGCGMSGLLNIKLAKTKGCRVIATDIQRKKMEIAQRLGADFTINATEDVAKRLTEKNVKKADVVILCTSADEAVQQAWTCIDKGGVIVFFAVPAPEKKVVVPINGFWTKEITLMTSYYCGPPDIAEAIRLIRSRKIKVNDLITHRLPLQDIHKGFQLVMDGRKSIKVIIKPHKQGF